jgi:hypothetical protein
MAAKLTKEELEAEGLSPPVATKKLTPDELKAEGLEASPEPSFLDSLKKEGAAAGRSTARAAC